jgi:hypothetical protein
MATPRKALRAVAPDEKAPPKKPAKPLSLAEAVETGDYRLILIAQRREIASSIPEERGPAKAALHRQLSIIAKELEALEVAAVEEAAEDGVTPDEEFDASAI